MISRIRDSLRKQGIKFIHDIVEQSWGQRVLKVYDPDMYIVEFGETMEVAMKRFIRQGMSTEETAKRSSMPLEMVRQLAKTYWLNDMRKLVNC